MRKAGSLTELRRANRGRVLAALRAHGALSRARLVEATALSRSTVTAVVAELLDSNLAVELEAQAPVAGRSGRPPTLVRLHGSAAAAVGVEISNRLVEVTACDLAHEPLGTTSRSLDPGSDPIDTLRVISELVDGVLARTGLGRDRVVGVGIALPGPIRRNSGMVGRACTLPPWIGVHAHELAAQILDLPVLVGNDANLGALAEVTWGAARGRSNVAYIYTAKGIGAGLVLDGRIYAGASGTAGEIGHTTIDEDGLVCECGNRGCLNTVADAAAIVAQLRHSHGELSIEEVIDSAHGGDIGCRRVLADAGRHIGVAIANLYNLLDPELLVFGGNLARAGDILLDPLRDSMSRRAIQTGELPQVVTGELHDQVVVRGATAAILRDPSTFPLPLSLEAG